MTRTWSTRTPVGCQHSRSSERRREEASRHVHRLESWPTVPLSFRFSGPMAPGMEQYFDLHRGGLDGPVVPMTCGWSADRATLTCNPGAPLQPRTTYAIHMGGALTDGNGQPVGYDGYGPMMGGQWIQGGTMPGIHGGSMGWGMMGGNWRHANGSYGMLFSFTTA